MTLVSLISCNPTQDHRTINLDDQLVSLLELHTYEHVYRDLVYYGEERSFLFVKTMERAALFSVDIRVRAGVDLSEGISVTPDRTTSGRVTVRLPAAKVLQVDADETTLREYFIRERGGRIGFLELSGQLEAVKARTAADAVRRGILTRADANARAIVTGFLSMAGFSDIAFEPRGAGPADEERG